jgi:hypothetical protein
VPRPSAIEPEAGLTMSLRFDNLACEQ